MRRMGRLLLSPAMVVVVLVVVVVVVVVASPWVPGAAADPQATLLNLGCSQYNATPTAAFLAALNSTFGELRANLSSGGGEGGGFATASEPRAAAPAFAMAQCRPYVIRGDCVACFDAAATRLRAACGAANGGRAILDVCVVRYESAAFFDQATLPGNTQVCNGSAVGGGGFADAARGWSVTSRSLCLASRGSPRRPLAPACTPWRSVWRRSGRVAARSAWRWPRGTSTGARPIPTAAPWTPVAS